MLKLSVKTKVDPLEALDRATRYFEEKGLRIAWQKTPVTNPLYESF